MWNLLQSTRPELLRRLCRLLSLVADIKRKVFVLDTSVLLSAPASLEAFGDNDVVLPIIVLTELEAKRHHPELGWAARTALRRLEAIRERHGGLTEPFPVNDHGGTVRVELNHRSEDVIPESMRGDTGNDHRILMVALNLKDDGYDVVLVTQDLPLRLRAGVVGLAAEEFSASDGCRPRVARHR